MPFEITSKPDRGNRLIAERHGRARRRGRGRNRAWKSDRQTPAV